MAHIHTTPGQYDLTVSAFIIRTPSPTEPDHQPLLLLHRHKTLAVLIQPGGHVELDETPWQAIEHEIREETGYDLDQLRVLQPPLRLPKPHGGLIHPQPVSLRSFPFGDLPHFHTDLAFAFVTGQLPRHPVGADESALLVWLSRQQLADLPANQTYEDVRQLGLFFFDHLLTEWTPADTSEFATGHPN